MGFGVMGFKVYAFVFALVRWVALVALALVPTLIVVVAWRRWRGQPLWSLSDLPAAAEVTLCLAWLSLLMTMDEVIRAHAGASPGVYVAAVITAAAVSSLPVMLAYGKIEDLRRILGLAGPQTDPLLQPQL